VVTVWTPEQASAFLAATTGDRCSGRSEEAEAAGRGTTVALGDDDDGDAAGLRPWLRDVPV
jgi:hypothetical protein